jgi:uncharacterized membrane protein
VLCHNPSVADSLQKTRRPTGFAIFLIVTGVLGWFASFDLLIEKFATLADPSHTPSCDISPIVQCGVNLASTQGAIFGFPNPVIGVAAFAVPIVVGAAILAGARFARWFWILFNLGVLGGITMVVWLIGQSIFILGTLCPYCMLVWTVMIPMFVYVTAFNLKEGHFGNSGASRRFAAYSFPWVWVIVLLGYVSIVVMAQLRLDAVSTIIQFGL